MRDHYDFIIVGSGAGGAAAAYRLATEGRTVLIIERGRTLPKDSSTLDVNAVLRDGVFRETELWMDSSGAPLALDHSFNLGGKTKWYGACLLRLQAHEFFPDTGYQCVGWPFGLEELVPYYDEAEALLGVNTFEMEPTLRALLAGIEGDDSIWRVHPQVLGMSKGIFANRLEARRVDHFASPSGLKSDAETSFLERVSDHDNAEVLTDHEVVDLLASDEKPKTVNGVVCANGARFRGGAVLLACGALQSPLLLGRFLRYRRLERQLPCYDSIGRNYQCHIGTTLLAVSARPKVDTLCKTVWLENSQFPHSIIQSLGWIDGDLIRARLSNYVPSWYDALVPRWLVDAIGKRAYAFVVVTEDGSHPENRILDADGVGALPKLDYDRCRLGPAMAEHTAIIRAFRSFLLRRGTLPIVRGTPPYSTRHASGTLRAGLEPRSSVVDAEGAVHGMDNLYVADGSVLPRLGRVGPALTIYAWGLRLGAHLGRKNGYTGSVITAL